MNACKRGSSSNESGLEGGAKSETRKIFFSRHGERQDFIDSEWRAHAEMPDDAPLTSTGEQQARALGARLAGQNVRAVFASPFHRTVRTASLAASRLGGDVRVLVEPGVCERLSVSRYWHTETGPAWLDVRTLAQDAGLVDGVSRVDTEYEQLFHHDFNKKQYPESTSEFADRCQKTVDFLVMQAERLGNILVIGHVTSVKGLINTLVAKKVWWKPIPCMFFPFLFLFSFSFSQLDMPHYLSC